MLDVFLTKFCVLCLSIEKNSCISEILMIIYIGFHTSIVFGGYFQMLMNLLSASIYDLSVWEWIIGAILIIAAIVIILVVLLQEGRQANVGVISGAADTFLDKGAAKTLDEKLAKWTKVIAIVFFVLVLGGMLVTTFLSNKALNSSTTTTTTTTSSSATTSSTADTGSTTSTAPNTNDATLNWDN